MESNPSQPKLFKFFLRDVDNSPKPNFLELAFKKHFYEK